MNLNPTGIFGALILAALGTLFTSKTADAASLPIGPGDPSAANAKLEEAIKSAFERDERMRAANLKVRADVTKNEVTLSGRVDSEAMRARAVRLAKEAHVGVVVKDNLTVRGVERGARVDDGFLHGHSAGAN